MHLSTSQASGPRHIHGPQADHVHVINDFGAIGSAFPIALGMAAAGDDGKVLLTNAGGSD